MTRPGYFEIRKASAASSSKAEEATGKPEASSCPKLVVQPAQKRIEVPYCTFTVPLNVTCQTLLSHLE
jgi:hypothetical protein